jgi:hypothetical protein
MEPITIGAAAASVLGMAGEALLKGGVGEAAKDAYKALKQKVAAWAHRDVEELEQTPASTARRNVVAEVIDAQPGPDREMVKILAERLIALLKDTSNGPVGLDIKQLDALAVDLGSITVTEGTGARIGEARVPGTFKTGNINVGVSPQTKK